MSDDRIQIDYPSDGLEIRIESRKSKWLLAALAVVGIWFFCTWGWWILFLITRVVSPVNIGELVFASIFLFFFLLLSVGILLPLAYGVGWLLRGQETIKVAAGSLKITKELFGRGTSVGYDLKKISNLRSVESTLQEGARSKSPRLQRTLELLNKLATWLPTPAILFDYGDEKQQFGLQLDNEESQQVILRLRRYLPESAS
jgi:hypothetical protein